MNEIEKMYKNAGLSNTWVEEYDDKQIWHKSYNKMIESMMKINDWSRKVAVEVAKKECRKALPPFAAEKQIKLLEFNYKYSRVPDIGYIIELKKYNCPHYEEYGAFDTFQEALCADINYHWEYLTEEEKEQIRGILNG